MIKKLFDTAMIIVPAVAIGAVGLAIIQVGAPLIGASLLIPTVYWGTTFCCKIWD